MPETPDGQPPAEDHQDGGQPAPSFVGNKGPGASPDQRKAPTHRRIRWPVFWSAFFGVGSLAGAAAIFYFGVHWMEERIDKTVELKLSDETILRKIAAQSRPSLIFDAKESIISDMGAVQFVKEITIKNGLPEGALPGSGIDVPLHIHVDFTKHIANAPIVTSLFDSVSVTPERGKGLAWEFNVEWNVVHMGTDPRKIMFRLEIIP